MKLAALLSSPFFLAGAVTVSVGGAVALGLRRQRQLSPEAMHSNFNRLVEKSFAFLPQHATQRVKKGVDPYSLVSVVAIARTTFSWLAAIDIYQASLFEKRMGVFLASSLSEREKIRAVVVGVIMPIVASDTGGRWSAGSLLRQPLLGPWANLAEPGGSPLQQKQIVNVLTWLGYYFLTPGTACCLRGATIGAERSALPPGWTVSPYPGASQLYSLDLDDRGGIELFRDAAWELAPNPDQRARTITDLFLNVEDIWLDQRRADPSAEGCVAYTPNPCAQITAHRRRMAGLVLEANILDGRPPKPELLSGWSSPTAEGYCQAALRQTTRLLLDQMQPHTYTPPPQEDVFSSIVTAIGIAVGAVATLLSAGGAAGLVAAGIASKLAIAHGVALVGVQLATAIASGDSGELAHAVGGAIGSSLGQSLAENAQLLAPQDLTAAAGFIAQVGGGAYELSKTKSLSFPPELRAFF